MNTSVFVIDLDGTLLYENGNLPDNDIERLIAVQKMGNRIILATGRNYSEAKELIYQTGITSHHGAAILADGQYIMEFNENNTYEMPLLNNSDLKLFLKMVDEHTPIQVITPKQNYFVFNSIFNVEYWKLKIKSLFSNNTAISKKQMGRKLLNGIEKIVINKITDKSTLKSIQTNYELVFVHDKKRFEVKKRGVNKGNALAVLIDIWQINNADLYIFGNDDNDISMMKMSINSFAVYNGTENLKKASVHVLEQKPSAVVDCIENISREKVNASYGN